MTAGPDFPSAERLAVLALHPEGREMMKKIMQEARARIDRDNTWLELCATALAATAGERAM